MSEMAPAPLLATVLAKLREAGRDVLPLTYVNSSAAIKAVVGACGGAVCTSANAPKMLKWALDQGRGVLFLPDKMLGQNTCNTLGVPQSARHILDIRSGGACLDLNAARQAEVLFWPGQCVIHARFKAADIAALRAQNPDVRVVIHPECAPETVAAADAAGSTSFIIKYVAEAPAGADIVIGTEINLVNRLANQYRGQKTIRPLRVSSIIFCSPCPGYGDWPGFALMDLMQEYMPANQANHVKALRALIKGERELWAGCIWYPLYRALMQRDVQVVTLEQNLAMAKQVGLNVTSDLKAAFATAMKKHGPDAKVAFVPYGRYTVFPT